MRIEHVKYLLPDYVLGKIEIEARSEVDRHVESCPVCSRELEDIRGTLNSVRQYQPTTPFPAYFNSILPRVRETLGHKTPDSWWTDPVLTKLALPFATAALAIGLLVNIGFFGREITPNAALTPMAEGLRPEDVVDFVMEASRPIWMVGQTQEVAQAIVGEHLTKEYFLQHSMTLGSQPDFEEELPFSSQQLLKDLDEEQIDRLLKKLGERTIL